MSVVGNTPFGANDRSAGQLGLGRPGHLGQQSVRSEDGISTDSTAAPSMEEMKTGAEQHYGHEKGVEDGEHAALSRTATQAQRDLDEQDKRDQDVHALARRYTTKSTNSAYEGNPFEADENSPLNPNSPKFSSRAFAKSLLNMCARDPEKWKQRTAGFSFKDLDVYGFGSTTDYQKTVGNVILESFGAAKAIFSGDKGQRINILQNMEGLVHNGEMLVVLGPPGSGCSTFLKTIAGETHGFFVEETSKVNYQGISPKRMHNDFRGEAIYTAEVDVHFPQLTVGQTLDFAAQARAPRNIPGGAHRSEYARLIRDVIMAVFGISHTVNTRVGNDFVRGVSGGERKRVSIAEAALGGAPLQCWDNSTRGLDSANAIEFCKTLRQSTELSSTTAVVAIYQAPQSAYDLFDKVLLLYEGRQIFFGRAGDALGYFTNLGFDCPEAQTVADYLTSMTSPQERTVRPGFENRVPRTSEDFARVWKDSPQRATLIAEIDAYNNEFQVDGEHLTEFQQSRRAQQSKHQRVSSPYTLSYMGQVKICLQRGFWRLKGDPTLTLTQLFGNFIMSLIISSIFYNMKPTTTSFFSRSAVLFFAILVNAFGSALEILTLYAQRPIVEKHSRYAFYHPSCEAMASMITDLPYKITNAFTFNITLYFMCNLNRHPGNFFYFVLISFMMTLVMSMLFRTIASVSRTLSQAMAPAAVLILAIVIYTGFALPVPYMRGWARWINYMDPVAFGFESLMINEFAGREFLCSTFIPSGAAYANASATEQVCSAVGAVAGASTVDGTAYIVSAYQYMPSHKWRNFGILWVFLIGLMSTYLIASEYITAKKSKGEVLVFRRGHVPAALKESGSDEESGVPSGSKAGTATNEDSDNLNMIKKQTAIFHWEDVCYEVKIKSETRRILDHVDGWVKPGTLTALMGVSGAGKTTLLDVLATRTTMGVITGGMFVDGRERDASFQRKTGYVQQQDLHLSTSTVREALSFSALLRQPASVPRQEKLDYVDEVIRLLDMSDYADAVVGVPGEGLNVEQRKRLTIGVELAARPALLLFLDEPTSGLDSQTSWAICDLMEKLTKNGQAILCTIHQPSAMLFQRFNRLLFLAKGGRTVYFGEVGKNSAILRNYLETNGASPCPADANPAEWMLEVIGAAPGTATEIDWPATWRASPEYQATRRELERLKEVRPQETEVASDDKSLYNEFAAPTMVQLKEVLYRVFQQYWRTPSYIYSKMALCVASALFIGFSFFNAGTSQQELQNQMFSVFMLFTIFGQLVQQIMPHFVTQRSLYEARERPSKTYSWFNFMVSNIIVELPWNSLMAVLIYFCWYYPIGLVKNATPTDAVTQRGGLMFMFIWQFLLFTSTFTNMVIAAIETAETGGNIANLTFTLTLLFCGVLASPKVFPGFWIFMYRVSPFTYFVDGMLSVGIANNDINCAKNEFLSFDPPSGMDCVTYLTPYLNATGGAVRQIVDPSATKACEFCALGSTNDYLSELGLSYHLRWRNFGILWSYILFNAAMAVLLYWIFRVPKKTKAAKEEKTIKEKA
ncbi:ZEB2-regulated ABC transporter [Lachnellula occidentalis]|uniref:ZEB2-regulated ABC transporter n=1 Tax=Lachnellula occidentalis TaxID=215460 RepID=A0A8H8RS86_9HELO|nr:ZEB2-regulated ABC transporter [Lachnellula occidentalis]